MSKRRRTTKSSKTRELVLLRRENDLEEIGKLLQASIEEYTNALEAPLKVKKLLQRKLDRFRESIIDALHDRTTVEVKSTDSDEPGMAAVDENLMEEVQDLTRQVDKYSTQVEEARRTIPRAIRENADEALIRRKRLLKTLLDEDLAMLQKVSGKDAEKYLSSTNELSDTLDSKSQRFATACQEVAERFDTVQTSIYDQQKSVQNAMKVVGQSQAKTPSVEKIMSRTK